MGIVGNIQSQINIIELKLNGSGQNQGQGGSPQKPSSIWEYIKNCLKSLSAHLFQLLSQMGNFKEWSVQGTIGASNFFGFSGDVKVQITFEI